MRAYAADYSKLGSGESPWSRSGPVVDVLDVADLESESEHDYALLGARDGEQMVFDSVSPGGQPVVDGGRTNRSREQFVARLPPGQAILAIVRLAGPPRAVVRATVNDVTVTQFELADDADGWSEQSFEIPARSAKAQTRIDLRVDGGTITVFHYWFAAFR